MNQLRFQPQQFLSSSIRVVLSLAIWACVGLSATFAHAQLQNNQTNGFGNNRLVTFTYLQNFDCVDQPLLDLDFNGIPAESDPNEMQTPICQPVTEQNTQHIFTFLYRCFLWTMIKTLMMRCHARMGEDQENYAARPWETH